MHIGAPRPNTIPGRSCVFAQKAEDSRTSDTNQTQNTKHESKVTTFNQDLTIRSILLSRDSYNTYSA